MFYIDTSQKNDKICDPFPHAKRETYNILKVNSLLITPGRISEHVIDVGCIVN